LEKLVIIPTYNEKENIKIILQAIFDLQQDFHVLVIDDGSPDGTAEVVKDLQLQNQHQLFYMKEVEARFGYCIYLRV
jgi:dolichol-phosphate mannosyltransferase